MDDNEVSRMIQVGIVTAVDHQQHSCRVKFPETDLTSDWLRVLRQTPAVAVEAAEDHGHNATVSAWMPRVNDAVLVAYIPVFNSDGFVLGVI